MSKWPMVALGDLCHIAIGRTPSRSDASLWDDTKSTSHVWLSIGDLPVQSMSVLTASKEHLSDAGAQFVPLVPAGTLLMSFKLSVGRTAIAGIDLRTNEAIAAFTNLVEDLDVRYLGHALQVHDWGNGDGSNDKLMGLTLNKAKLSAARIPLPPLDEQKRIVAKLDLAQTDVSRLTQVVDTRENRVGSLSAQLIDSQYLRLPESVPTLQLGEVAEIRGGKRLPRGTGLTDIDTGFRYVTVSDFNTDGSVDWRSVRFITSEQREQIARYTISNADVYVSIAGTIGKTGVIPIELEGANLTENACKLVLGDRVDRDYIFWYTRTSMFSSQAVDRTRVSAQPKLALERLKTLQLPVPALPEQRRIAHICSKIASAATDYSALCSQQRELIHLLRGLSMNEILSGAA